jgi:glutamate racemase
MTMLRHAAPDLVYAAEAKLRGDEPDGQVLRDSVAGLITQTGGERLDAMVLGCTHFPLVQDELAKVARELGHPHDIQFVDGSDGIARRIVHLTEGQDWPTEPSSGIFVTTGSIDQIAPYRPHLATHGLSQFTSL